MDISFSKIVILMFIFTFLFLPGIALAQDHHSTTPLSYSDLDLWTHITLIVTIATLFVGAMMVQLARPYFLRILKKFTLRLGADLWWLTFILVRDGLMFASFLLGLIFLHPHAYTFIPIAMPFAPLSVVFMAGALVIKLIRDADEERRANDMVTLLVVLAGVFNMINLLMFIEGGSGEPFTTLMALFASNLNPALAMMSWNVSMGLLGLLGLIAIIHVVRLDRSPPKSGTRPFVGKEHHVNLKENLQSLANKNKGSAEMTELQKKRKVKKHE